MAHKRISCAICHITFKTWFNIKEHMNSGANLLKIEPAGDKGRFVEEFML